MLAGILSNLAVLLSRLTSARAGYLDKLNITGNVADGNDYTSARAGKIDNLDAAVTTRAPSSTAVSNTDYTAARAGNLDSLVPSPQIQAGVSSIAVQTAVDVSGDGKMYFDRTSTSPISADKQYGVRLAFDNTQRASLYELLNVLGSGWVYGCIIRRGAGAGNMSGQIKLTIDGVVIADSGYVDVTANQGHIILGFPNVDGNPSIQFNMPIRFSTSLKVEYRNEDTSLTAICVYTED